MRHMPWTWTRLNLQQLNKKDKGELATSMAKLNMLEQFETSAPVPRDGMNAYLDNSQKGQSRTSQMYDPSDSESS